MSIGELISTLVGVFVFGTLWYFFNRQQYSTQKELMINTIVTTLIFAVVFGLLQVLL